MTHSFKRKLELSSQERVVLNVALIVFVLRPIFRQRAEIFCCHFLVRGCELVHECMHDCASARVCEGRHLCVCVWKRKRERETNTNKKDQRSSSSFLFSRSWEKPKQPKETILIHETETEIENEVAAYSCSFGRQIIFFSLRSGHLVNFSQPRHDCFSPLCTIHGERHGPQQWAAKPIGPLRSWVEGPSDARDNCQTVAHELWVPVYRPGLWLHCVPTEHLSGMRPEWLDNLLLDTI